MDDPQNEDVRPTDRVDDDVVSRGPTSPTGPEIMVSRPPQLRELSQPQELARDLVDDPVRQRQVAAFSGDAIPDIVEIPIRLG